MTVVIVDPRWPSQLSINDLCAAGVPAPVHCAPGVPKEARRAVERLSGLLVDEDDEASAEGPARAGTWVTIRAHDAETRRRQSAGEPVVRAESLDDPVARAQHVMAEARRRGEWEASVDHASLVPFLLEESGEFAAVAREWRPGVPEDELLAELSDVFLQVLFHAEIARERGSFDLGDVAERFVRKMRSRAPYLFDGSTGRVPVAEQNRLWAAGKAAEKGSAAGGL